MESKRILIITQAFYPEQSPRAFRATELVKEFCRQGHHVTVFAPEKSGICNLTNDYHFDYKSLGKLKWGIFNFKSLGIIGRLYNKAVNRLLPLLLEYPSMELFFLTRKALIKDNSKYDLLISIAVPYTIHWGVAAVWNKKRNDIKTWVADCGDPYMGDESDSITHPFYFKYFEKWFCRKVNWLTVPTKNSYLGYYKEFWDKVRVIPQGFNFREVKLSFENHANGCPTFGYAGGIIPNYREPFDFMEYLCTLNRDFKFIVYTKQPKYFEQYKDKLGNKMIIKGVDDRLKVLYEFSEFDFVVNFDNRGNKQVASKLIDYHIIQKPILNIPFRSFDKNLLMEFFRSNFSNALIIENPEQYKIEAVSQKFLELAE